MAMGCNLPGPPRLYEPGAPADLVANNFSGESVGRYVPRRACGGRRKWRVVRAVSDGRVILTGDASVFLEIRGGTRGGSPAGQRVFFSSGVLGAGFTYGDVATAGVEASFRLRTGNCGRLSCETIVYYLGIFVYIAFSKLSSSGVIVFFVVFLVCESM